MHEEVADFNIETRPEYIQPFGKGRKYGKLLSAIKNIGGDKCVVYTTAECLSKYQVRSVANFRFALHNAGKKQGMNTCVVEKDGMVYLWNRK